jgi:4-carboxymuconolactone decarboxylase
VFPVGGFETIILPASTTSTGIAMTTPYENGLATRKAVMGEDFVAAAFANATAFTAPIQEHITRAAWGDVWQRPGLELKTRSLITVAMLTALGKQHELKGHVRGALNNGASVEEIQEVLLHATIYCGVPAAVEAFRTANEVVATTVKT